MASYKAKKIETYYDRYFNTSVFEYRGKKYEVTYGTWQTFITPAWIQHRDAQKAIDDELENPKTENEHTTFDIDEIFELLGW